jgi:hypothetical protein
MREGPSDRLTGAGSNHLPLLRAKAVVVSREGKGPARPGQVTSGKKNESEPPFLMSKRVQTISKPRLVRRLREEFRRDLFTGGTVSGI